MLQPSDGLSWVGHQSPKGSAFVTCKCRRCRWARAREESRILNWKLQWNMSCVSVSENQREVQKHYWASAKRSVLFWKPPRTRRVLRHAQGHPLRQGLQWTNTTLHRIVVVCCSYLFHILPYPLSSCPFASSFLVMLIYKALWLWFSIQPQKRFWRKEPPDRMDLAFCKPWGKPPGNQRWNPREISDAMLASSHLQLLSSSVLA